jgi:hypothetical protein
VEEALAVGTSKPVPFLREEEDLAVVPAVNPVSIPPDDVDLMGVDLIVLSSSSEEEVDWEVLAIEDDVVVFVGSWSPSRI